MYQLILVIFVLEAFRDAVIYFMVEQSVVKVVVGGVVDLGP